MIANVLNLLFFLVVTFSLLWLILTSMGMVAQKVDKRKSPPKTVTRRIAYLESERLAMELWEKQCDCPPRWEVVPMGDGKTTYHRPAPLDTRAGATNPLPPLLPPDHPNYDIYMRMTHPMTYN